MEIEGQKLRDTFTWNKNGEDKMMANSQTNPRFLMKVCYSRDSGIMVSPSSGPN
jgi:hypothetical protein